MKLKYYLRGLGLGVLLTSIIMGVALSGKNKSMSDEEVIRRAKQLGMVEAENTLSEYSGAQKNAEEEDDGTTSDQAVLEDGKEETKEADQGESQTGESVPEVDETAQESASLGESSESIETDADIALAPEDDQTASSTESISAKNTTSSQEEVSEEPVKEEVKTQPEENQDSKETSETQKSEASANETKTDETSEAETENKQVNDIGAEAASSEQSSNTESAAEVNYVVVVLPGGTGSDTCSAVIKEAGLVDDAIAFNRYLVNSGLDRKIRSGTKQIPKGSSYEEIAAIITK